MQYVFEVIINFILFYFIIFYFALFGTDLDIKRRKNAHITFSGDKIPHKENALILANHQAWTDIYLIHSVANRRDMLYNCKVSTLYM